MEMSAALSSTSRASFFTLTKNPVRLLWLMSGLGAFLAPALWNGFPLVFFDTGGYVNSVLERRLIPGRSVFYGLFLWAASCDWRFLWGPVLVQSLLAVWLIYLMLRCHDLPSGPAATALFCAGLGLSTSISWYTSQLMPDILVPLVVLALWLLSVRWERLGGMERAGLALLALLALLSHMSCMALAVGLAGIIVAAKFFGRRQGWTLKICSWSSVTVVAASLILMPLVHLALTGKAGYTPGGPEFLAGKMVQDGIAQRWLRDNCPEQGIKLCGMQGRMPKTADEFLWGARSPFQDIGEWTGRADAELNFLVEGCLTSYTGSVAWGALRGTVQQMGMVATGDGLLEFQAVTRGVFTDALPGAAEAFNAARQQQDGITPSFLDALNLVHVPVAGLSVLGLLLAIGWGLHSRRYDLAGLAAFILCALVGNAFICGALSGPHNRYQNRCVWLATLGVGISALCWRQARRQKQNT